MLRIFTVLEEIRETQRIHSTILQSLTRQMNPQPEEAALPDVTFPLTSEAQFDDLENRLTEISFQNALVSLYNVCVLYLNVFV